MDLEILRFHQNDNWLMDFEILQFLQNDNELMQHEILGLFRMTIDRSFLLHFALSKYKL